MAEAEVIRILLEYSDKLTKSNILSFVLRFMGWGFIKALSFLVDSTQGTLNTIMKYLNFFDSKVVNNLIDKIKPVMLLLLVISLLYIGYQLMMNGRKFNLSNVATNIIVAILVIFFLPTAMKSLGEITTKSFNLITSDKKTISDDIISNNVTDIYLYDQNNFTNIDVYPRNRVDTNKIIKIDPTEEIDRSKVTNKKVFENEVRPITVLLDSDLNKKYTLERINGWFKIDSEYYRWDINFFQIIGTLFISALVLLFTMIKVVKLMLELAFSKTFIIIGALADISYGQKTKQMLMHILSIYITIISVGLTLQIYILGTAWLNNNINGFASVMVNFGAGLFVIDGPNLLEKIFGVDAGLSSGLRTLMGINSAMDILGKVGKGIGAVAEMGKKGLSAGAILGAGVKGFRDGARPDLEDEMKNSENGFNPLQDSLPKFDDVKSLGDGNSNNDNNDLFETFDKNSPNDIPPNNDSGGNSSIPNIDEDSNNAFEDLDTLDNSLGNSNFDNLDNNSTPILNDDINDIGTNNEFSDLSSSGVIKGDNFEMYDSNPINSMDSNDLENNNKIAKSESKDWQYGRNTNNEFRNNNMNNGQGLNLDFRARNRIYEKPNYIDPNETRNIKDMLSGVMKSKVNDIKNSDLANNMRTSYKIGNNTAKDLRRYVGIKEQEIKYKIILERIRRNL